ncbi:hypothetical protein COR50_04150 [Chitinophaga caeni]|uniref:MotA/TolQ/ExbB proton channel domain-containing protein n=1 Tax=Chitinophaga caeni TaxID=2029983 RepID=A0A291QR47_9BACT|nr:hypothetical protein [Chitinophaga caeni]ATL46430.1 hypothetical protein COR50_04150 [Chitinophaga caeni]
MNSITFIELLAVACILIIQTVQALKTRKKIRELKEAFPAKENLVLKRYLIPFDVLKANTPTAIIANLHQFTEIDSNDIAGDVSPENPDEQDFDHSIPNEFEYEDQDYYEDEEIELVDHHEEIGLVNPTQKYTKTFDETVASINVYLIRNKGAATDFNLIRDIVERNLDAEENEITQTSTVPLYLGLMGTMLGIVFGLINLLWMSDQHDNLDVRGFLGGVSIAMMASLYGLGWTVYNSNFAFKGAQRSAEQRKNIFYTFILTDLIPLLNQNVSSSIYMLHTNLVKFNDNFTLNIDRLSKLLLKNYDTVIAQDKILQSLEKIDITEFAKANITVFRELQMGATQFQQFTKYIQSLNLLVNGTTKMSQSFESILTKTNSFENIANKLDSRVEESNRLMKFLNDHYQQIEARGELMRDAVVDIDDTIAKSLRQLELHTQEKVASIKQFMINEEDLMAKHFKENRGQLSNLAHLENMSQTIDDIKQQALAQSTHFAKEVVILQEKIAETNFVLNQINKNSLSHKTNSFVSAIKRMFKPKKAS